MATEAIIQRANGERFRAKTLDISGSGMRLSAGAVKFEVGEEVRCCLRLYEDKPPQSWGLGKVIRQEEDSVAIDFEPAVREGDEESVSAPSVRTSRTR